MGLFTKLFEKKKKKPTEYIEEEEPIVTYEGPVCHHCGMGIYGEQKVKSYGGKKFHLKPCWREIIKQSRKMHTPC